MSADIQQIKLALKECDFATLFRENLGWDQRRAAPSVITYKGQEYKFTLLAEKAGFKIYLHSFAEHIPKEAILKQLDTQLNPLAAEHLTIFIDANKENQAWLWIKRDGKKTTPYLNRLNKRQSGESLAQKIYSLFVSFEEEEKESLNLTDVLNRVLQGFDVEKVTKKFYDGFKEQHEKFLIHIKNIPDADDLKWYTSIMLNRLMFVYFIQRKGLLDNNDPNNFNGNIYYLQDRFKVIQDRHGADNFYAFYRRFLRRLFHEGLNQRERSHELEQVIGDVPYLNGGLFDVHQLEEKYPDIQIEDEAFKDLFAFFQMFDWHLDERSSRSGNEINPDVLGYIFEKYINQKQMGAYYTKEDITEYISKNTVIPYIFERTAQQRSAAFAIGGPIWSRLQTNPDAYIYESMAHGLLEELPAHIQAGVNDIAQRTDWNQAADERWALLTETWREVVARRQRYHEVRALMIAGKINTINDLITYNLNITQFAADVITNCAEPGLLHAFYAAIKNITVLDPTCGSGAFLFAALNILKPLYQACIDCMGALVDQHNRKQFKEGIDHIKEFQQVLKHVGQGQRQQYFILKSIIVNNLYGVDIMEEAIEICKLRLFLKLIAQLEKPKDLEPLPDIDFNVLAGNTLIGFTSLAEIRQVVNKRLFNVDDTEKTLQLIEQDAQEIESEEQIFRNMQTKQGMELDSTIISEHKRRIRRKVENLRGKLDPYLATEYDIYESKYTNTGGGKYEEAYIQWKKSHKPFHWWSEFYKIINGGGFDVVIGNPPWKEYSSVRKMYTVLNSVTERSGNLYSMCIERSLNLRSPLGLLSFIVQLPLVNSSRMISVRNLLLERSSSIFTITFDDRPSKLFEGLQHCRSTIFISQAKGDADKPVVATTKYQRWSAAVRENIFPLLEYSKVVEKHIYPDQFPKYASNLEVSVFGKVQAAQKYKPDLAFRQRSNKHFIFYQEATQYWIKATIGLPFYANDNEVGAPPHGRFLYFDSPDAAHVMGVLLNSSLFYLYFIAFGDCFHLSDRLVSEFPVTTHLLEDTQLVTLSKKLMTNLKANAERKTIRTKDGKEISYDNYYGSRSKPIIDEIDRILAQHYGFTPEELDFIINYDIKYRMGRENSEEGEE